MTAANRLRSKRQRRRIRRYIRTCCKHGWLIPQRQKDESVDEYEKILRTWVRG